MSLNGKFSAVGLPGVITNGLAVVVEVPGGAIWLNVGGLTGSGSIVADGASGGLPNWGGGGGGVDPAWSGSIVPSFAGLYFVPGQRSYTNVIASPNQGEQLKGKQQCLAKNIGEQFAN